MTPEEKERTRESQRITRKSRRVVGGFSDLQWSEELKKGNREEVRH
jgi:hypothetical protein